jgi:hypothetical protein
MDLFFNDSFSSLNPIAGIFFVFLTIWSLMWKGAALWTAVSNKQKYWFIAVLVLNTAGLLEIVYLFFYAKKRLKLKEIIPSLQKFFEK